MRSRAPSTSSRRSSPRRGACCRYGNMSSATVLFVLKEVLASRIRGPGCAVAFGPGLSIESPMFEGLG